MFLSIFPLCFNYDKYKLLHTIQVAKKNATYQIQLECYLRYIKEVKISRKSRNTLLLCANLDNPAKVVQKVGAHCSLIKKERPLQRKKTKEKTSSKTRTLTRLVIFI